MKRLFWDSKELDLAANELGFSDEILMENAATAMANLVRKKLKSNKCVVAVLGGANNAADAVATARMLSGEYRCKLFFAKQKQNDVLKKQIDLALHCGVEILSDFSDLRLADCIIDGIFGVGLKGQLDDEMIELINNLNKLNALKISCDLPSGLDLKGNSQGAVFKADFCVSMGAGKLGLYSDFAKDFVGKIKVARLGLNEKFYQKQSEFFKLDKSDLNLPFRKKQNTNKGDFGHVFILSGKMGGAARLSALAALNIGAGLVSIIGQNSKLEPVLMQSQNITQKMKFGAVGMGLGELDPSQKQGLFEILTQKDGLVLDADLCYEPLTISLLNHQNLVITPHPKEFASLLKLTNIGDFSTEFIQQNRFSLAKLWSEKFTSTLVLKGANTIIASEGKLYIMPYGSACLAKGGSGDVLSGVIVGLLAQGYDAKNAAINGTLAHALAVKKFKQKQDKNNYAINADDIIKGLGWLKK